MKGYAEPQRFLGDLSVGRFSVEVEVGNYADVVRAREKTGEKVRRRSVQGLVDSGATRLVLPQALAKELRLRGKRQKVKVRYADGRRAMRTEVEGVWLKLCGRDSVFSAIVEPKRDSVLIGPIVLEELDLLVDCTKQRVMPRDPDYIVSEIE